MCTSGQTRAPRAATIILRDSCQLNILSIVAVVLGNGRVPLQTLLEQSGDRCSVDSVLLLDVFAQLCLPCCCLGLEKIVASCVCPDEYIFLRDVLRQRIISLPVFAKLAAPLQEFILGKAWASSATTVARDALAAFDAAQCVFHENLLRRQPASSDGSSLRSALLSAAEAELT